MVSDPRTQKAHGQDFPNVASMYSPWCLFFWVWPPGDLHPAVATLVIPLPSNPFIQYPIPRIPGFGQYVVSAVHSDCLADSSCRHLIKHILQTKEWSRISVQVRQTQESRVTRGFLSWHFQTCWCVPRETHVGDLHPAVATLVIPLPSNPFIQYPIPRIPGFGQYVVSAVHSDCLADSSCRHLIKHILQTKEWSRISVQVRQTQESRVTRGFLSWHFQTCWCVPRETHVGL